ncbi:MAG: YkvA family protein [Kiloniellaceae bacterium]
MSGQDLVPYNPAQDPQAQEPEVMRRNETKVARGFWAKLRRGVGRVPFVEDAVGAYFCAFDPATPRPVKAMLLAALAYFVVPSDLIPDFIAGLGFTDDATVLFATLRLVAGNITPRHRRLARRRLAALGLREASAADSDKSGSPSPAKSAGSD